MMWAESTLTVALSGHCTLTVTVTATGTRGDCGRTRLGGHGPHLVRLEVRFGPWIIPTSDSQAAYLQAVAANQRTKSKQRTGEPIATD